DVDVDALQIVLARAAHADDGFGHSALVFGVVLLAGEPSPPRKTAERRSHLVRNRGNCTRTSCEQKPPLPPGDVSRLKPGSREARPQFPVCSSMAPTPVSR